jgi:hypothetical protein
MQWMVNEHGEWSIEDPNSVDTAVWFNFDGHRVDALQHADYREFRRLMNAIGSEAVARVLSEAYREPFEGFGWIECAADERAIGQLDTFSLAAVHVFIRAGFTLRDGWLDRLESDTRQWQKAREGTAEKALGREAFDAIKQCRQRFGFGWRGTGGGVKVISAAH